MPDLPFQTLTQFTALGLTLLAGLLIGWGTASGGRKWRERFHSEEADHIGYRDRAEADLREAGRRARDLEAENARLRAAVPAGEPVHSGHSTAALAGAAAAGAAVTHVAHEHHAAPAPIHTDIGHVETHAPAAHDDTHSH